MIRRSAFEILFLLPKLHILPVKPTLNAGNGVIVYNEKCSRILSHRLTEWECFIALPHYSASFSFHSPPTIQNSWLAGKVKYKGKIRSDQKFIFYFMFFVNPSYFIYFRILFLHDLFSQRMFVYFFTFFLFYGFTFIEMFCCMCLWFDWSRLRLMHPNKH